MTTEVADDVSIMDRTIADFETRLEELKPSLDEAAEIQRAIRTIRKSQGFGESRRGRTPERANEFIATVTEHPGHTVTQLAHIMGLEKPNYLYRVAAKAVTDGYIVKSGKVYEPATTEENDNE